MTLWTPFAAGQRITAGKLNSLVGEWTPYTPIWSAATGTTLVGDGTLVGKYRRVGNTIEYRILFEWGTTTNQSVTDSNWSFSLPVPPFSGDGTVFWPGNVWIAHSDSGYNRFMGGCYVDPPTNALVSITANASNSYIDAHDFPGRTAADTTSVEPVSQMAVASDRINFWGSYEAAE